MPVPLLGTIITGVAAGVARRAAARRAAGAVIKYGGAAATGAAVGAALPGGRTIDVTPIGEDRVELNQSMGRRTYGYLNPDGSFTPSRRRRRRRRLATASDIRDLGGIVGVLGKGEMAKAYIAANGRGR